METPSQPQRERSVTVYLKDSSVVAADTWSRIERLSKALSVAAIPIVLAIVGGLIQWRLQDQTVRRDYVTLAVHILQEPDDPKASPKMKEWAANLLNKNSPAPLPPELLTAFKSGQALLPTDILTLEDRKKALTEHVSNLQRDRDRSVILAQANRELIALASRAPLTASDRQRLSRASHAPFSIGVFGYNVPKEEVATIATALRENGFAINFFSLMPIRPGWFSSTPTVIYYSDSSATTAREVADQLRFATRKPFGVSKGAGFDVPSDQREYLLYVHTMPESHQR